MSCSHAHDETVPTVSYACSCSGCVACEPANDCQRIVPNGKRGYCRECRREYDRRRDARADCQKSPPLALWPAPKAA